MAFSKGGKKGKENSISVEDGDYNAVVLKQLSVGTTVKQTSAAKGQGPAGRHLFQHSRVDVHRPTCDVLLNPPRTIATYEWKRP